jgi:hypothetical protein
MEQQQVMAAVAAALERLAITQYKARRLTPQVRVVQALQPKLPAHKRTLLEAVEVGHGQLTLRHRVVWAAGVLAGQALAAQIVMEQQALQILEAEAVVLGKAPIPQRLLAGLVAPVWSSLETAEQPLHSQVHLQLQWLAVTLYIHSLATVQ